MSTKGLAEKLDVSSPSVTGMLKRLSRMEPPLIDYTPHRTITLTPAGRSKALRIIRRHRLLESFLFQILGYQWDEVHDEAERLEHYISERFEEYVDRYLGRPEYDPHGSPIPRKDGHVPAVKSIPLTELEPGVPAKVSCYPTNRNDVREYLESLGIRPEQPILVTGRSPFDGPTYVRVGPEADSPVHGLGERLAEIIMVEPDESPPKA